MHRALQYSQNPGQIGPGLFLVYLSPNAEL
mgnify:CR=1 FL=1